MATMTTTTAPNLNRSEIPAYQTNTYLWGLRFIQILFAVIIVGLTGSAISDWKSIGCSSPSKLSFNFAIALLSLFLILYFIICSGPYTKLPYYSLYTTLALEAVFILLWIVAAALSTYDCAGLCDACAVPGAQIDQGYGFFVWVNDLICECWFAGDYVNYSVRRDALSRLFRRGRPVSGGKGGGSGAGASLGKTLEKGISSATKKGLDATMILLFLISLATILYMRYSKRSEKQAQQNAEHMAEQANERMDGAFKLGDTGNVPSVDQMI